MTNAESLNVRANGIINPFDILNNPEFKLKPLVLLRILFIIIAMESWRVKGKVESGEFDCMRYTL